jgi:hypothetical protein
MMEVDFLESETKPSSGEGLPVVDLRLLAQLQLFPETRRHIESRKRRQFAVHRQLPIYHFELEALTNTNTSGSEAQTKQLISNELADIGL